MFERYTEPARHVLFFSRYEASQLGSVSIEPEHLLLGLLREEKGLASQIFAHAALPLEALRKEIERLVVFHQRVPTSVELPFSAEAKRVLVATAAEADRLSHDHIGTEHLLLGLLRKQGSVAESILTKHSLRLEAVREDVARLLDEPAPVARQDSTQAELVRIDRVIELVGKLALQTKDSDEAQMIVDELRTLRQWVERSGEP